MPIAASDRFHSSAAIRLLQVKNNREIIRRIDVIDKMVHRCLRAANLPLQQRIQRPLHVAGSERPAVVKLHAVMKMKNISERIGNLPALGQAGATFRSSPRDSRSSKMRLSIRSDWASIPDPGIKIGRTRLDDHYQCVRLGG